MKARMKVATIEQVLADAQRKAENFFAS